MDNFCLFIYAYMLKHTWKSYWKLIRVSFSGQPARLSQQKILTLNKRMFYPWWIFAPSEFLTTKMTTANQSGGGGSSSAIDNRISTIVHRSQAVIFAQFCEPKHWPHQLNKCLIIIALKWLSLPLWHLEKSPVIIKWRHQWYPKYNVTNIHSQMKGLKNQKIIIRKHRGNRPVQNQLHHCEREREQKNVAYLKTNCFSFPETWLLLLCHVKPSSLISHRYIRRVESSERPVVKLIGRQVKGNLYVPFRVFFFFF